MAARPIDQKREINGVLYLAAAVILAVSYYLPAGRSGWLGEWLIWLGRGLFGSSALALPVLLVYMAVDYLLERELSVTRRRFTYVLVLLMAISALLHLATVDMPAFRQFSSPDGAPALAWQALTGLWRSGIDPGLIGSQSAVLSGGLLGGGMAMALYAIAGPIGSMVMVSALVLSLVILLFNVSLSHAVGRTAQAIQQTHRKVDEAVRSQVGQMRQTREQQAIDRKQYDLKLDTPDDKREQPAQTSGSAGEAGIRRPEGPALDDMPAGKRPTLLESLKKLFAPDLLEDGVQPLSSDDLPVPQFLAEDPEKAAGPAGQAAQAGDAAAISRHSAFNLEVTGASPDEGPSDGTVLPAGIHRIQPSGPAPSAQPAGQENAKPGQSGQDTAVSREHWADRSDGKPAPQFMPTRPHPAGAQLSLELPYQAPPLRLLREDASPMGRSAGGQAIKALGLKLEQTLESFGIQASVIHVTAGPTITRFELSPGPGVKVSRIVSLADDIALNLAAMGVRIEAPIPGKAAIGIEIPNKETQPVLLRSLLESAEFNNTKSPLTAVLGRDISGLPILCDLARMPHLLIAGATGSGKSVCINAILISILYRSSPDDVRMLMIDPKVVELSVYNGIPHLLAPVVTDPKKAANTLLWAVNEMVRRYGLFAEKSVRDINAYNAAASANAAALSTDNDEAEFERLPLILLVIDELSDLMATTPAEVEDAIARLTAMARAAGIHLIIATQRPSVDVITGVIKANIPSRIAFAVASQVDSRTILDMAGAEKLLGKGDMLYYPQSASKPVRGQGAFVTDAEVEQVLNYIKTQHAADYDDAVSDAIMTAQAPAGKEKESGEQDELLPQALDIVVETGYASVSLLQRRMNVGYPRAARLIDKLHDMGYIGPFEGSKPRRILITAVQYQELKARGDH